MSLSSKATKRDKKRRDCDDLKAHGSLVGFGDETGGTVGNSQSRNKRRK